VTSNLTRQPAELIFLDPSGRRCKKLRRIGYATTGSCLLYMGMVAVSLAGAPVSPEPLRQPDSADKGMVTPQQAQVRYGKLRPVAVIEESPDWRSSENLTVDNGRRSAPLSHGTSAQERRTDTSAAVTPRDPPNRTNAPDSTDPWVEPVSGRPDGSKHATGPPDSMKDSKKGPSKPKSHRGSKH
jgi:hypothetical protein